MTMRPTDEMLTAYLDGELGPEERTALEAKVAADHGASTRLEFLSHGNLAYAEAFVPMLDEAPREKLEAMLKALPSPQIAQANGSPAQSTSRIGRRGLIAAAIGCLVAGVVADRAFIAVQSSLTQDDEDAALRAEVAEYLALYTADSLLHASTDANEREAQLQFAGQRLGLALDPFAMNLGNLQMRRTQLLEYDGKPLGQILYLDPAHGPVALCIIAASSGAKPMQRERRSGLNLIYWASESHSFVMAARNPMEDLKARADEIRDQLTDRNQA